MIEVVLDASVLLKWLGADDEQKRRTVGVTANQQMLTLALAYTLALAAVEELR
jgi:hypothetical protein